MAQFDLIDSGEVLKGEAKVWFRGQIERIEGDLVHINAVDHGNSTAVPKSR